jgi:hypothetical protein
MVRGCDHLGRGIRGKRQKAKRGSVSAPFNPFQTGGSAPGPPHPGPPGSAPPPGPSSFESTDTPLTVAQPPLPLLIAAGVAALVGIVAGAIFWSDPIALIGWALAGPVAIFLMGAFVRGDTYRRAEPVYVRPTWIGAAYAIVAVASVAGIVVGAVGFALWLGRL